MYFKQILNELCGCASYVIACQTKEAMVVDPAIEIEEYCHLIDDRELRLKYVVDTHVHADHVSGARKLAAKYGAALCLHEAAPVVYPFRAIRDHDVLEVGQLRIRAVHTPGHRHELISLLVINPPRSPEASMVLTGDSLLVGDVGRPDFGGGDASDQYDSLTRLLRLPDWVAVFPGHFEGPCGKGMCGRPSTTIGFERLFNPLARLDRPQFVDALTSGIPPRPLNMAAIEATNRGAADLDWSMLTTHAKVAVTDAGGLSERLNGGWLVDVREPSEYAAGHVPGAVNVPQADLALRLDEVPRDRQVFLICAGGFRSLRAAQFLAQCGISDVVSVAGGTEAWKQSGRPLQVCHSAPAVPTVARVVESDWAHGGGGAYYHEI